MLSQNAVVVGWSWTPGLASRACEPEPWRELDRKLTAIAKQRAALDAEELALIREAVRVQLWRPLGMTSMREYLRPSRPRHQIAVMNSHGRRNTWSRERDG